ncbi:MAG: phosphate ABC transporter permease subunit PstC [Candidatus Marinimicrobia bacterium]|nr:phosphate ABC transporter permease subunit PstC [Candidatus Neomarinimicrobiota bacterium]
MNIDKIFKAGLFLAGFITMLLIIASFISLLIESIPAIKAFGIRFLTSSTWDPVLEEFGFLPFFIGTLLTSIMALLISIPFSLAVSLFLSEYFKSGIISKILNYATDLLSGIPSVIYGFWGLFVLMPVVRYIEMKLGIIPYGVGILTASLILSIMIIPFSSSVAREVIRLVPSDIKEAAYSMGATHFEVIRKIILPYSKSGIFAGIMLAFGRALGETMAVTMVIGNANRIPKSLFEPGNTLASVIANEFAEASSDIHLSALIELGLLLFIVTLIINFAGSLVIKRFEIEK